MSKNTGKVSKVIGAVVDVEFSLKDSTLPEIYDSLEIQKDDGSVLVLEVQSHIGENAVRTISMDSTDGVSRGTEVVSTGNPIQMPIGKNVDGRLFNVVGDPIDGLEDYQKQKAMVCQFTERLQHLINCQLQQKFYLQVSK